MGARGDDDDDEGRGQGWRIVRTVFAIAVVLGLFGGGAYLVMQLDTTPAPPQQQPEFQVTLAPPPPPPPPPEVKPPPEEEMIKEETIAPEEVVQPEEELQEPIADEPEAADEPPGPLGLDAPVEGPGDQFNLVGKPGGRGLLGGGGGGRGGTFPGQLAAIAQRALSENARTRLMEARMSVRFWLNANGQAVRVELEGSTGDARLDGEIRAVLLAASYRPPPADIRMPVVTRVTARRPA